MGGWGGWTLPLRARRKWGLSLRAPASPGPFSPSPRRLRARARVPSLALLLHKCIALRWQLLRPDEYRIVTLSTITECVLRLQNWLVKYGFVSGLPPAVTIHSHRAEEKPRSEHPRALLGRRACLGAPLLRRKVARRLGRQRCLVVPRNREAIAHQVGVEAAEQVLLLGLGLGLGLGSGLGLGLGLGSGLGLGLGLGLESRSAGSTPGIAARSKHCQLWW